eukprot:638873-Rhodomonas_salina.3
MCSEPQPGPGLGSRPDQPERGEGGREVEDPSVLLGPLGSWHVNRRRKRGVGGGGEGARACEREMLAIRSDGVQAAPFLAIPLENFLSLSFSFGQKWGEEKGRKCIIERGNGCWYGQRDGGGNRLEG